MTTNTLDQLKRETVRETANVVADYVSTGMTNYNTMRPKPPYTRPDISRGATDYKTLASKAPEILEEIASGQNPIGDCAHRSFVVKYVLGEMGIDSRVVPVFATVRWLSREHAPKEIWGKRSDHFIVGVNDKSIFYVDSGRSLEDVEQALDLAEIELPEGIYTKIEADPKRADAYLWDDLLQGRKIAGMDAVNFALRLGEI